MRGITFNNIHSIKTFDLYVNKLDISPPSKIKVYESVPFMNGSYDFSYIYGDNSFGDRTLKYSFELIEDSNINLNIAKIRVENWLLACGQCKLFDDAIPGYYFLAECTDISESDNGEYSLIEATFIAYPFKICSYEEGDIAWDDFNFELDILQETKFDVSGSKNVKIHNVGATSVFPEIICSSTMEVTKDNVNYKFNPGTIKNHVFELNVGENNLTLKGNGSIEFKFRKEVL